MIGAHVIFVACAVTAFAPRLRRWPAALPLIAAAAALSMVVFDSHVTTTIVTFIGAPSITTIAILADLASRRILGRSILGDPSRRILLWFMAAALLLIYPAALGFVTIVDVYRTGFLAVAPGLLAAAGVVFVLRREYGAAAVVLIALLALDVQLLPSVNVFDYLVDPYGGFAATGWAMVQIVRMLQRRSDPARTQASHDSSETLADRRP